MGKKATTSEDMAAMAMALTFVGGMLTYQVLHTVGLIGHVEPGYVNGFVSGIAIAGLMLTAVAFIVEG